MNNSITFTVSNDISSDQRMHRICNSLQKNGYSVSLIGRRLKNSPAIANKFAFNCVRLKCFFNSGKLFYLEYNLRLFFYLLKKKPDIYSAVDLDTVLPNLLAAKLKRKKCVYDAHEYFTEVPEVHERWLIKKVWATVENYAVPRTDANYTVSNSIAKKFKSIYNVKFDVIRNISRKKNLKCAEAKPPFIIYQGMLNRGRCIEQLIKAMPAINCNLLIVGKGDIEFELHQLVQQLEIEDKVSFAGFVPPEELDKITPCAFLGFNVLENDGLSYYYSLANKCFDYIQAEIPVISSPFPEYLELDNEFPVFLFSSHKVDELEKNINSILKDRELYQQLKSETIRAKQFLNWEEEEKKLLAIYNKL